MTIGLHGARAILMGLLLLGGVSQDVRAQSCVQPPHFVVAQIRPRRIVGVGEVDEPRARCHGRKHRIDIGA